MAGMAQWQAIVDSNLEQLNGLAKEFRNELENLKKEKYTIKLNIDEDKLNSAIKNLDKMLSNLGQGTGDFKEFQNLSKQFNSLVSDVQTLKKALGSIDDAGASELLSSIKNIDQSLSTLSQHIIDVNKDFSNIGKNANDNVNQINEAKKATEGLADATEKLANANKNVGNKPNVSSKNLTVEVSQNDELIASIRKKKEELASYELQLEETRYEVEKLSKSENEVYGFSRVASGKQLEQQYDSITKRIFGKYDSSLGKDGSKKWLALDNLANIDESTLKSYQMWQEELQKVGYTLSEIRETSVGLEADILPIDGKAITDADEFRKALSNMTTAPSENVELLNKQIAELETKISSLKSEISSLESSRNSPIKDVFQDDKINQANTSAKELDKTLEQVNIPSESFDEILSKLDRTKSELGEIVKITKQSVADAEGKFSESYTLKDKYGSTETYGVSSNTEKGQLLRSNIVEYDAKIVEEYAKLELEAQRQITKEIQQQNALQQKKGQAFIKEQQDYISNKQETEAIERNKAAYQELIDTIQQYSEVMKRVSSGKALPGDMELISKFESKISELKKNQILSDSQIEESERKLRNLYNTLDVLEKKRKESQISSMESTLEQFEKQQISFSIKPDDGHSFAKWTNKINELGGAVGEYRNLLTSLKDKDIISNDDITQVTELEKRIKNLILTMQKTPMSERGYDNLSARKVAEQINSLLKENSAMSKQAKAEIKAYYNEVASGTATRPLKEIYNDALKVVEAEREMGRSGKSFFDAFKNKVWYGAAGQLAGMFGIYDVINMAKEGLTVINEFDDGLTTISYTMDLTKSQLDGLGESVVGMAKDLGTSIDNAMQVSQIYANLNTSAEEIKKLSEPTLILSNLTKFDASTVADDIQAVTQQFDIAAENSMHIADVYDYISKNIAVDYAKGIEGMADGLKVAGSTAQEAGLNFEQTASIIAKAMETTRLEGSQVGNGLKTILTRLSKVGELSGEVDNDTLSKASESLHKIGVEVYNTDGKFRQFDVIIGELADKWDTLSDAEQANISFNIAA